MGRSWLEATHVSKDAPTIIVMLENADALAMLISYEAKGLRIGESADPAMVEAIRAPPQAHPGIVRIHAVLTLLSAPSMVIVIVTPDFVDTLLARDVERIVMEIEDGVAAAYLIVARVFVRPMASSNRRVAFEAASRPHMGAGQPDR